MRDTAADISQPATRSGIEDMGARKQTARMKASSKAVVAAVKAELTTLVKTTKKATRAMPKAASQVSREAKVPKQTSTPLASASTAWSSTRTRSGPAKSTSRRVAKAPRAEKVATAGLAMTLSQRANMAGITIADLPARRRAARSRSRDRNHAKAVTRDRLGTCLAGGLSGRPRSSRHDNCEPRSALPLRPGKPQA